MSDLDKLKACPFCGLGETRLDENTYWTGIRSRIISVTLRHHCENSKLYIELTMPTVDEVIEKYNSRI